MAPESLRRNFYSFKSDLYAIGIVLFEMIAGHTPHEAHTERELLEKISNEIPLPSGVKHPKLAEFFLRISVVSDAKRMNKDEFENFDFGSSTEGTSPLSHSNSDSSFLSTKGLSTKGISNDELSTNRFQSSCADLNSKLTSKSGSKVHWLQSASSSKHI